MKAAIVVNSEGFVKKTKAKFELGDPLTKQFAIRANQHLANGGLTLAFGEGVTREALVAGIQILNAQLEP